MPKRVGWVYIVKSNGLFKIGWAWNLDGRLLRLRTAAPYLEEIDAIPTHHPQKLERWMHIYFNRKRVIGEWFALEDSDLEFIKTVDGDGKGLEEVKFMLSYQANMKWGKRALREGKKRGEELGAFLDALDRVRDKEKAEQESAVQFEGV